MKKFAVVELFLEMDETLSISCCNITCDKNGFEIKEDQLNFHSLDELPVYLFNNTVYLSIHGKGIITKDIQQIANLDEMLSNGQTFTQTWEADNYHLLSMIRQELMNKYLSQFFEKKICIKKIFIGAPPLLQLLDNVVENKDISLYFYRFSFNENNALKISSGMALECQEFEYENKRFSALQTMLVALCILVINKKDKLIISDSFDEKINLKSRFYYTRFFKLTQRIAIFLLFFLLMINFFFFMLLSQKSNTRNVDIYTLNQLKTKEDSLGKILKIQAQKFSNGENKSNNHLSILTDRIASTIPVGIKLTDININPAKFSRDQKAFKFDNDKMLLNGYSDNSYLLNQWLKQLENKNIILKSNVNTYKQESGLTNGYFELEFFYNNQWMHLINKKQ